MAGTGEDERKARLGAALRANLKRRKAQARERAVASRDEAAAPREPETRTTDAPLDADGREA